MTKVSVVLLFVLLCCGCSDQFSKVTITHIEHSPDDTAHWYVLQQPYTVVELCETSERIIVPGIYGEVGDTFRIKRTVDELPR